MIRNRKPIFMNNHCIHDCEVRAGPTVQINTIKTTLKLVAIGQAGTRDLRGAHSLASAILLFMKYSIEFQAAVFRRIAEVIAEDGLQNAMREA